MRVILAAVMSGLAALGCFELHTALDSDFGARSEGSSPMMFSVPECEDIEVGDARACVTPDDGKWYIVRSFSPYTATEIVECGAEDGGPVLPCVWSKHRNRQGEYNYFVA
jgi:hypothetical protein